jgi:hypothetical protein
MKAMTYRTEYCARACNEMGAVSLVYIDVIEGDEGEIGTVTSTVRGTSDGEYVNSTKTHKTEIPLDWARIHVARTSQGWTVVP